MNNGKARTMYIQYKPACGWALTPEVRRLALIGGSPYNSLWPFIATIAHYMLSHCCCCPHRLVVVPSNNKGGHALQRSCPVIGIISIPMFTYLLIVLHLSSVVVVMIHVHSCIILSSAKMQHDAKLISIF